MSDKSLNIFLQELASEPASILHEKGYIYFSLIVMPRLKMAGADKQYNKEVLSDCWTNVGNVYHINKAPLRAEMAYKKGLLLYPKNIETIKKLIQVQIETGKFHEAFKNVNIALDFDPDNMELFTERQRIQDDINYQSEPLYTEKDGLWALNETLANDKFESVIKTVLDTNMDNICELKCLACAYGALAHHANYMQVWQRIIKTDNDVELEPSDYFFMPSDIRNSGDIKTIVNGF